MIETREYAAFGIQTFITVKGSDEEIKSVFDLIENKLWMRDHIEAAAKQKDIILQMKEAVHNSNKRRYEENNIGTL